MHDKQADTVAANGTEMVVQYDMPIIAFFYNCA